MLQGEKYEYSQDIGYKITRVLEEVKHCNKVKKYYICLEENLQGSFVTLKLCREFKMWFLFFILDQLEWVNFI